MIKSITFVIVLLLSACAPVAVTVQSVSPTNTPQPSTTPASFPLHHVRLVDDLQAILWASNPDYPQYDPGSFAYAEFPLAVQQLAALGPDAIDAADDLAVAITYPRPDSYLAAQTIISLGPDITGTLLPILIDNLKNPKPEVRIYSVVLLGFTGHNASCSIGNIAPPLNDSDPSVRSAAAFALEKILGQDLVSSQYEIEITPSFLAGSIPTDTPLGTVAGAAWQWWTEQGSKVNWHPGYGLCDP